MIVGATYAYFGVTANNNGSNTTISGQTNIAGAATLNTNISNLYLKLKASDMAESKQGCIYYANSEESGTPITAATLGNGIYTLATASLPDGTDKYNCTYNYELSATVEKNITDGSDENVKVVIKGESIEGGSKTYSLKELLLGTQTLTGVFQNLSSESNQTLTIESTVENTSSSQNGLAGNNYTITINPKSGNEGFSCEVSSGFSEELIASGELWQSGLEGDGYRYTGSGDATASTSPNNFICFGTNSLTECKSNENKYMYRIIGVFPDETGEQHLKLIKYKQLGAYKWHNNYTTDISWEESDLYRGLNGISGGSYSNLFIGNTTYDYLQDETWSNKIVGWKWTATNTLSFSTSDIVGPDYSSITTEQMYLHEMNKTKSTAECKHYLSKTCDFNIGEWTYPIAKIGLMYASDYQMSLGNSSLPMTGSENESILKTGWLHPGNNDISTIFWEWFMSRSDQYSPWSIDGDGFVTSDAYINGDGGVSPVFYLDSTVTTFDGNGEYATPYLIQE